MNPRRIKIVQHVDFNKEGATRESFHLQVDNMHIEDMTREELTVLQKTIDSALLYGVSIFKGVNEEDIDE